MKKKKDEKVFLMGMTTLDMDQQEKKYILKVRARSKRAAYECAKTKVEPFIYREKLLDIMGGGNPRKIYRMPEGWKNDLPDVRVILLDEDTLPGEGDLDYVRLVSAVESLSEIKRVLLEKGLLDEETTGLFHDLHKGYEWLCCVFGFQRKEEKQCWPGDYAKYEHICQCYKKLVERIEDLGLAKEIKVQTLLDCRIA